MANTELEFIQRLYKFICSIDKFITTDEKSQNYIQDIKGGLFELILGREATLLGIVGYLKLEEYATEVNFMRHLKALCFDFNLNKNSDEVSQKHLEEKRLELIQLIEVRDKEITINRGSNYAKTTHSLSFFCIY
jgi:hypothetical protein